MHIPKAESGLSKQLLSNFQADNSCDRKLVEAKTKMMLLIKKSYCFFDSYLHGFKGILM